MTSPGLFDNIPYELRPYRQWVVWRAEESDGGKPTKVPYNPATGQLASVQNPNDWNTFEFAVAAASDAALGWSGIGFVLTRDDPFAIIDLDDTQGNAEFAQNQTHIYTAFDSYSELSPSEKGLHIVVKANVGAGRRRNKVELYSQERYMTFTGNRYGPRTEIFERQELAMQLWHEMGKNGADVMYDGNAAQRHTDEEIISIACRAANGAKFYALHGGQWQDMYQSQSEADFAYMDILAYYTQNREQLHRMFLASALGQRDKAQRKAYRDYMIGKSFDRMLPPINFDSIYNAIQEAIARRADEATPADAIMPTVLDATDSSVTPPPGLVGDVARFIYANAPRPVPEIAIAGAIGLLAGIVGRSHNVSGMGLNQYVLLLAKTGTGKEAINDGVSRLLGALDAINPDVWSPNAFRGPSDMASGQGLLKHLAKRDIPSCVCIIGEFGLRFKSMADERAGPADVSLLRVLLDLYNKSGHGKVVGETVYSDREKNTGQIVSPAVTIVGESVPQGLYENLSDRMIMNGLLPRFTIIEYTGPRPARNPMAGRVEFDRDMIARLHSLSLFSLTQNRMKAVIDVRADAEAQPFLDAFDVRCDSIINGTDDGSVVRELWNRAHVKVLKLAALIAVGIDPAAPVITLEHATWARDQVERDIKRLIARFEAGEVGNVVRANSHDKQTSIILQKIMLWTTKPYVELPKGNKPWKRSLHDAHIVPYQFLRQTCSGMSAFRTDPDASRAIKRSIQNLIDDGTLRKLTPTELLPFSHSGEAYVLVNADAI